MPLQPVHRMSLGKSSWNEQDTVNDEFDPIYKDSAQQSETALNGPFYGYGGVGNSSITAFDAGMETMRSGNLGVPERRETVQLENKESFPDLMPGKEFTESEQDRRSS